MTHPRLAALFAALLLCFATGCDEHDHDEHSEESHGDHKEGDDHDDHDEGEEGVVKLSESAVARSGIRVESVTKGTLAGALEVPGEVHLNPDRVAHISPLVEGQLLAVDATVGDKVEAEQKLATLRSVTLGQARADLVRAGSLRSVSKQNLDRQERLRREGISSERSLLEARLAFEQANAERSAAFSRLRVYGVSGGAGPDMSLSSPITGVILERHATRGENVSPDDNLFVVADLTNVWVLGRVYEQHVAQVREGMAATLTLTAYPDRTWTGRVDFVSASLDKETRTLAVRVELDNPDGKLRPGLFGSLRLSTGDGADSAVLLPQTAIQTMKNQTVVFVPGEHAGEFESVPVTVGRSSGGQVEILAGLSAGAEVVVSGAFVLKSELMRSELGHGHAH